MTTFIVKINRNLYSYGFELKDEAQSYTSYAVVSKITDNIATESGLNVGDKVVSINGETVAGKNYISLKNNIRKSMDHCVTLEILKEMNFQTTSPDLLPPHIHTSPMKLSFGRSLIPRGSTQDKIKMFQNTSKNDFDKKVTKSNSLDCLNKFSFQISCDESKITNTKISSASVEALNKYIDSDVSTSEIKVNLSNYQEPYVPDSSSTFSEIIKNDVTQSISQDPCEDEVLTIPYHNIQIELPERSIRIIESNYTEKVERPLSLPTFDNKLIKKNLLPNPGIPESRFNYFIPFSFAQLTPGFMNTKSRSSQNLFLEGTGDWSLPSTNIPNSNEHGSMTDIRSYDNVKDCRKNKLPRQPSIVTNIPIKLRMLQFYEKIKSKGCKDYIMEPDPNGARFRKRCLESVKIDKKNDFVIKIEDVNKFENEIPHRSYKISSGSDFSTDTSYPIFSLMALNGHIHLKFQFNPTIFQDNHSYIRANETFNSIITSFRAVKNKNAQSINPHSFSQSSIVHVSLDNDQVKVAQVKVLTSSMDEFQNVRHNSGSNSSKSVSKSSAENLPNFTFDTNQSSPKSIFKQAIDKIKPEKKIKITQSNQVFVGPKGDFDEFQKHLEGSHLPAELESLDENGTHFNRYIYEVPRMNTPSKIPMIIYLCTEIVEKIGLHTEGIYRISGNQRIIRTLSNTLNKSLGDIDSNLLEWNNVHAVCGILKLFLRKLKQHLIPADLSHVLTYSCKGVEINNPRSLSKVLMDIRYHLSSYQIPSRQKSDINTIDQVECRWQSLQHILKHLSKVVKHRQDNNMDEHAISVCFNPVLMESWQKNLIDIKADNEITVMALELILIHQDWLFSNWHSEMDSYYSSEYAENALKYATNFIDRKYGENLMEEEDVNDNRIDINKMVEEILTKSTNTSKERLKLLRRHSSHIPGKELNITKVVKDIPKTCDVRRNSQITEALDLSACANWLKGFAKINEYKNRRSFTPSVDDEDEVNDSELSGAKIFRRQMPLTKNALNHGSYKKDITRSSNTSINSL